MENKFESHYEVLDTSKYNLSIKKFKITLMRFVFVKELIKYTKKILMCI